MTPLQTSIYNKIKELYPDVRSIYYVLNIRSCLLLRSSWEGESSSNLFFIRGLLKKNDDAVIIDIEKNIILSTNYKDYKSTWLWEGDPARIKIL